MLLCIVIRIIVLRTYLSVPPRVEAVWVSEGSHVCQNDLTALLRMHPRAQPNKHSGRRRSMNTATSFRIEA